MWELYTSNYSGFVIGLNFNKQFSKIFIHDNVNYHTSYEKHLKFSGTFEDYYAVNKKGMKIYVNYLLTNIKGFHTKKNIDILV